MKGKFMIIAALLGALTFGACVDSEESSSVTAVRNAKAEQLKSIATLNNAKAQAEATIAAAEAQLAAAQAQLLAAEAAAINAETEAQKIENQKAAAEAAAEIAKLEAQLEIDLLDLKKQLLDAQIAFSANADAHLTALYNAYAQDLSDLNDAKVALATAQATLAAAEKGLASVEDTYNKTLAAKQKKLQEKKDAKAAKEAELALVKEISTYDMSVAELKKWNEEKNTKWKDAVLKEKLADQEQKDAKKVWDAYKASLNQSAYMKAYNGTSTTYAFSAIYASDANGILPTLVSSFAYDHDGNKNTAKLDFSGFYGGDWNTTTQMYEDDTTKPIALFSGHEQTSKKYDYAGRKEGASKYNANFAAVQEVMNFNIVAANVASYKAIANAKLGYHYDSQLAAAANAVELAKSAFEKATNGASNKTIMDNLANDYKTVVNKIAQYETSLEAAQHAIANYQQFITEFGLTATSTIISATDYAAGSYSYPYATYTKFFNASIAALKAQAEADHWLNGGLVSTVAAEKAFLNSLKSGVISTTVNGVTTVTYVYENYGLYGIAQTIGSNFDSTTGAYLGNDNGYFAALEAQADLQEAYEFDKFIVDYAVAILETMAAEAENWNTLAITGYNEAQTTYLTAQYNAWKANDDRVKLEAQMDAIADLVAKIEAGAYTDEINFAEKIGALESAISTLNGEIEALEGEIEALTLEALTASKEQAIVVAKAAVADAELQVAIAEANLANTKAALDAALAE